jgi:hypothetical protein
MSPMCWSKRCRAADVKTCYGIVGDTLNRIAHAIGRSEIDWVHVHTARAMLQGKGHDVWEMMVDNFP